MKKIVTLTMVCFISIMAHAQILHPVKWSYASKKINSKEAVVFLKATIEGGWHIYSACQKEGGPVPTSFKFEAETDGKIAEPKPMTRFESAFNMDVSYFEKSVIFRQKIRLRQAQPDIKGSLTFMVCNDHQCLPPETISFNIPVK